MFSVKYFLKVIFLCFSPHLICCGEYIIFDIIEDVPNRVFYLMMPLNKIFGHEFIELLERQDSLKFCLLCKVG